MKYKDYLIKYNVLYLLAIVCQYDLKQATYLAGVTPMTVSRQLSVATCHLLQSSWNSSKG